MKKSNIFCRKCGGQLEPENKFCGSCGAQTVPQNDTTPLPDGVKNIFIDRNARIKQQKKRASGKKAPVIALLLIAALVAACGGYYWYDLEHAHREPDWQERAYYWYDFYKDDFTPPQPGSQVILTTTTGKTVVGTLIEIEDDKVLIEYDGQEVGIYASTLDNSTRYALFVDFYSRQNAVRAWQNERKKWLAEYETAKESNPITRIVSTIRETVGSKEREKRPEPRTDKDTVHNMFFRFLESE